VGKSSRINRGRARREELRTEADVRAKHRSTLSNEQQIERLNQMFGEDLGATKERARLVSEIEGEKEKKKRKKSKTSGSTQNREKREKKRDRRRVEGKDE
jgi:hypothetical protein